jgi:hypothetical protein
MRQCIRNSRVFELAIVERRQAVRHYAISLLLVALGAFSPLLCACQAPQGPPGMVTAGKAPDFLGTVRIAASVSSCPAYLAREVRHNKAEPKQDVNEYVLAGCWVGRLKKRDFALGLYEAANKGSGGLVIQHQNELVGWMNTESTPHIVRFTREDVCVGERGNSYWRAINIVTGQIESDRMATALCHFRSSDRLKGNIVLGLPSDYPTN